MLSILTTVFTVWSLASANQPVFATQNRDDNKCDSLPKVEACLCEKLRSLEVAGDREKRAVCQNFHKEVLASCLVSTDHKQCRDIPKDLEDWIADGIGVEMKQHGMGVARPK